MLQSKDPFPLLPCGLTMSSPAFPLLLYMYQYVQEKLLYYSSRFYTLKTLILQQQSDAEGHKRTPSADEDNVGESSGQGISVGQVR